MASVIEELRQQIKQQLETRKKSGMRIPEMAAKLEVKPATVYQLLEGDTTPTAAVLCNSCRNLEMSFQLDGYKISALNFPPEKERAPVKEVQLGLFQMAASVNGNEL